MGAFLGSLKSRREILVDTSASYRLVLAFLGLNVPLILLVLLRDVGMGDLTWLAWFYVSNIALGYYGLPLLVIVTLIFVLLMPSRRAAVAVAGSGIIMVLFVSYLFLDSYVYGIFRVHIDPFWVEFALKDYASLGITASTLLVILALLLGVAAMEAGIFSLASRFVSRRALVWMFPIFVVAAFAISQILHAVTYERNDQRLTSLTPCFPIYKPVTSHRNAHKYGDLLPLGDFRPAGDEDEYEGASMLYPSSDLRFDAPSGEVPPNIVVILIESWRYDALDETTTPRIFELGRESSVFLNHLSSGNQTTCGIFGLFYGLHPTYWTAVKANSASIDNPVLIDVLKERGYEFGVFARSNFDRHKIKATIFNGIEVHETFSGNSAPEEDRDMTDQVERFIEEKAREETPFMALAFYKSSHAPYEYPEEHAVFDNVKNVGIGLTKDTDPAPYLNDYRNALHYVDALAGEIVDRLRTLGVLDRTVVVVTTDHGESFNEQRSNFWGHGSNFTQNQVRVPFVLHAPGRAPQRIERRTSHIDLVPTLLQDFFGCTSDVHVYSDGRNLFDESLAPRPFVIGSYVSHAFIFEDDVYEIMFAYTKKYKLDDLYGEAAPPTPGLLKTVMVETGRFLSR